MRSTLTRCLALAGGIAVVIGCGNDNPASPQITPAPASVQSIAVTLNNANIAVAASSQATATLKDALGEVLTGRAVTWTSANSAIGTVDGNSGAVTGIAPGTTTIIATSGTVTGSATITIAGTVQTPANGAEVPAALPQVYLNTTMPAAPAAGGKIISVAVGGNLQSALNSAQPGDVIELANGGTWSGAFTLPNKNTTSTNWIVIRPASMAGVPAEGSRMTPAQAAAAQLPIILGSTNLGAITTDLGAHHYRFIAIEVSVPASIPNTGLLRLGSSYERTLAEMPHDLVLDRMYIHGTATGNNRRCVSLNAASTAVIDSYISECHEAGTDSQAIAGWSGPGPFKIVNNYIEASSENIMFGGADPTVHGLVPSDIEIRRNHVTRPTSWKGKWLVKNLFELKNAQRVLVEGNVFESNWQDGQGGSAVNLKSTNQNGTCPWCGTQDVTFRYNLIRNTGSGFNLSAAPDPNVAIPMQRITIIDNIVSGVDVAPTFNGDGRALLINGNVADMIIAHNTILNPTNSAVTFGGPVQLPPLRLVVRDNIIGGGLYGVKGPGLSTAATISTFMGGGGFRNNVLTLTSALAVGYPQGTFFASSMSALGFVDASALDFHLTTSSPFALRASDGRDPGADATAVNAAIAGVIVP